MARYRWQWRLRSSPEALWPYAADTNRFNRDAGVPAVEVLEPRRLRIRRFGIPVEWQEEPFEWIEPRFFSVVRRYARGPVAEMRVRVELEPDGEGTLLRYEVDARPRNLLGRLAIPIEIGHRSARRFEATFRRYDELARRNEPRDNLSQGRSSLVPGGRERLERARGELGSPLAERLAELVAFGDDEAAARMRPYELARAWGAGRRETLELFLLATRAGLLELRWDLLCPLCRGATETAASLGAVHRRVHCDTCQIDFDIDFDRSVEVTFRPAASIRETVVRDYCVGGPRVTPHVVAQLVLAPGETRDLDLRLDSPALRVRGAAAQGSSIRNDSDREQIAVVERTAWDDDAATAADVTSLQLFRDIFSSEALRPGEPISVGMLTVLFTDLRGSTRYYRDVGDAPAFGAVMNHLDVLREEVARAGGTLVKTMGDAVMAVFRRPAAAVEAAFEAQRRFAGDLPLKVGIHCGPCIAVNQNDRLDYFGSTVNAAARLVDLSTAEDVVVSGAVLDDPEVAALQLESERAPVELKGFEGEELIVVRLRPCAGSSARSSASSSAA
jgi:class 3 adenylate cyclase